MHLFFFINNLNSNIDKNSLKSWTQFPVFPPCPPRMYIQKNGTRFIYKSLLYNEKNGYLTFEYYPFIKDEQQIDSNGVPLGQENVIQEEKKDISTISTKIKYETGRDPKENELEKDEQQIDSNGVPLGQENVIQEEKKDISTISTKIKYETGRDPKENELEKDEQQIDSNGVPLGQENVIQEEKKDISTISTKIKYETGRDPKENELEKVMDKGKQYNSSRSPSVKGPANDEQQIDSNGVPLGQENVIQEEKKDISTISTKIKYETGRDPKENELEKDEQQIDSNGVPLGQENVIQEEKKDISTISTKIKYETGRDPKENELKK
ncbi:hypothetical protein AGLY_005949, partial [Aphis glycines]